MTQNQFDTIVYAWIAMAVLLLPVQLAVTAPYGRHVRPRWGPVIGNRVGWIVMEAVSPIVFAAAFLYGGVPASGPVWVFLALWMAHYLNRTLVFPLRTKTAGKTIPLAIVASAILFNAFNGWSNGFYLGSPWAAYTAAWFLDIRFGLGIAVFLAGAAINIWADNRLLALRRDGTKGYSIPRGGLFEKVSCPNHLGEIVEWTGFAIACWNLPAAAFAVWTAANLAPRAISHHRWYRREFPDYPEARRALLPGIL